MSGVVDAASDGETIVLVYSGGYARRYDATTGAERGSVGTSGVEGCSISGGTIILSYQNGTARRYDARSEADQGSV